MGDRNRSRYGYGRRQRDGPWRPPLPPPDQGRPVPLWEREFCSYVGNISWQRFCENKKYVWIYCNLEDWDDSGALENFRNAKSRFWATYHGQPSDNFPLPDPDMYIDEVDHQCTTVDPELAADVEKVLLPTDISDYDYSSIPVMGWVNAWEDNNCTVVNQSAGNSAEKPAEVLDWGWEPSHGSNATWGGGNNESSGRWDNNNSSWRAAAPEKQNWGSLSNNQYASNNRYNSNFFGGSNNNSRYFNQRNNKQKDRREGFQRSSRQDPPSRGKKMEWRPVAKKATQQDGNGIEGGS